MSTNPDVGAGAAGCVLANRLTEDPNVRVALVEAGPDRNARKAIVRIPLAMVTFMAPALAFLGGPKFMSWFETEPEPGLQGRSIALPRGRGTGGCTNVNGQIFAVQGGTVSLIHHPLPEKTIYKPGKWTLEELDKAVPDLLLRGTRNPQPPADDVDVPGRPKPEAAPAQGGAN